MRYTDENGLVPSSFDDSYQSLLDSHNEHVFDRELTVNEFKGSAEGNLAYANTQNLIALETAMSEQYVRLQNFIRDSKLKIENNRTIQEGIKRYLESQTGFDVSIASPTAERTGLYIAFNYDDENANDDTRELIARSIQESRVAGMYAYGSISRTINIENSQQAVINWESPKHPDGEGGYIKGEPTLQFRLTIKLSKNAQQAVDDLLTIKNKFEQNFNELFRIGNDIEPETYFEINRDAPYASDILCEYQDLNSGEWTSVVKSTEYFESYKANLSEDNILVS